MFYVGQIFEDNFPPEAGEWCNDTGGVTIEEIDPIGTTRRFQIVEDIPEVTVSDYDAIMEQHITDARFARGYTTREPTEYLGSSVPRWAQDAADYIAFRDKVMLYGLEVINEYAATGKAPSLEVFKAGLEMIKCEWSYNDGI